jgi:hypothetical protein
MFISMREGCSRVVKEAGLNVNLSKHMNVLREEMVAMHRW